MKYGEIYILYHKCCVHCLQTHTLAAQSTTSTVYANRWVSGPARARIDLSGRTCPTQALHLLAAPPCGMRHHSASIPYIRIYVYTRASSFWSRRAFRYRRRGGRRPAQARHTMHNAFFKQPNQSHSKLDATSSNKFKIAFHFFSVCCSLHTSSSCQRSLSVPFPFGISCSSRAQCR